MEQNLAVLVWKGLTFRLDHGCAQASHLAMNCAFAMPAFAGREKLASNEDNDAK